MTNLIKATISKFLPLVILYLLFIATFLGNSDYEAIITLTAAIPLAVYIFNKDSKVERVLRYILYVFAAGLIIYIINLFLIDYNWFLFCQRNYYAESIWGIFKWNNFFIYDLKYLVYIGVIFLVLKDKTYLLIKEFLMKVKLKIKEYNKKKDKDDVETTKI